MCCPGAQEKALAHSEELFDAADTSKDGRLQLGELRDVLRKSSEQYSHFAEHARFLDGCGPDWAASVFVAVQANSVLVQKPVGKHPRCSGLEGRCIPAQVCLCWCTSDMHQAICMENEWGTEHSTGWCCADG